MAVGSRIDEQSEMVKPSSPDPSAKTDRQTLPKSDTIPRDGEKEKIKRQLYNLIDRVDKL